MSLAGQDFADGRPAKVCSESGPRRSAEGSGAPAPERPLIWSVRWLGLVLAVLAGLTGCTAGEHRPAVVVYTAHDQVFSENILGQFERETGIEVRAVYDTEATKTVELVNRLLAEAQHPQCDTFWNNEIVRTIVLQRAGLLEPYRSPVAEDIPPRMKDGQGHWTGFAARARVLICNKDLVPEQEKPRSIVELTQPKWKGRVAMAYPLFGTTATHAAALFATWGEDQAKEYFQQLKDNGIVIAEGNAAVKDMVARGEVGLGFTDTDDAAVALQQGKPVGIIYPDQGPNQLGTLVIPNTVGLIRNSPNPEAGKRLIDHLLSRKVEALLARSGSAQMPVRDDVPVPEGVPTLRSIRAMQVDWEKVADAVPEVSRFMGSLFVR